MQLQAPAVEGFADEVGGGSGLGWKGATFEVAADPSNEEVVCRFGRPSTPNSASIPIFRTRIHRRLSSTSLSLCSRLKGLKMYKSWLIHQFGSGCTRRGEALY